jgi:hypothetical protein
MDESTDESDLTAAAHALDMHVAVEHEAVDACARVLQQQVRRL